MRTLTCLLLKKKNLVLQLGCQDFPSCMDFCMRPHFETAYLQNSYIYFALFAKNANEAAALHQHHHHNVDRDAVTYKVLLVSFILRSRCVAHSHIQDDAAA